MKKGKSSGEQLPVKYPSVPATQAGAYKYNEPRVAVKADRVPGLRFSFPTGIRALICVFGSNSCS